MQRWLDSKIKQEFYDAKSGDKKKGKKTDTTGSIKARIEALEMKIRELTGIQKPAAPPAQPANPMGTKQMPDRVLNPDTGDPAMPGEPTVKYDGSVGSGPSYHFNGRKI